MELTQCVHRAVRQTPDLPATIFGDRVRTWAESADRVARLAAALGDLGIGPGDRVGLLALNSDVYHELLLAVPWADAVVTPVNTRWAASEIAYSLQDSDTRVLYVDETFAPLVPQLREEAPCLRTVIGGAEVVDYLIDTHEPAPDARRGGDSLAGIFYTGGTTGRPKGVMLSHDNILVSALGSAAAGGFMSPGGRYLHAAPMFHLADGAAWSARNVVGGTHVMVPSFTPKGVAEAIERHRVTDVLLVPTMIQLLVDSPEAAEHDLSSLRHLVYGASPISEALLDRAAERLPTTEFTQAYGMTELAPVATLLSPEAHHNARLRRSAGQAAPHVEVMVVDDQDHEVPRGTVGEIVVRGDNVMLGYWNRPEETASALRGGWMHTGDGGYMDENGYVYVVDRLKDMIVSGGENVYSAEVENALAKHPAVASCAVIGVPDEQWGERVHAVVVLVDGHSPTADELRDHCREHIAGYKTPRSVEFVEELPVSGAGKILKRVLRSRHWEGRDRGVS
ncbi:long-chain-fatty-acid--CoA ligase [Kutzneria kofuensis]|uniref:Acyl-CoA synthetase (AMP-forming)/AMP-acid ligase II n=1 Tax=Kutzneria kofuensis TaxID=103725 RepID=A0A7W9NK55_9PSEU|nr:long-chain-fatty-acid--CoA ligase [Kutzneria kofuensis]MBB5895026.1 acyl-CoA synthetase (AMP-forming)/AMP-acid ligase II [Kutzneria kofuensis]